MNKQCTNPSCRRTFSTLNFGGQCPFCGKTYPQLESGRKRGIPAKIRDRGSEFRILIAPETTGHRIVAHVNTRDVFSLLRADERVRAIRAFREEMDRLGFRVGLREGRDFVMSVLNCRPLTAWRLTGVKYGDSREIEPVYGETPPGWRAEKKKRAAALAMTVEQLDLSIRAFNCLRRAGITTVKDLVSLSEDKLKSVRNMGRKSLEEVKCAVASLGLGFRPAAAANPEDGPGRAGDGKEEEPTEPDSLSAAPGSPDADDGIPDLCGLDPEDCFDLSDGEEW